MNKLLGCACAAVLLLTAVAPCFAADAAWTGTWKMNPAKSKMTGDTFTIVAKPGGMLRMESTVSYDFACDGKPYPTLADRTVSCTGSPATGYDFTVLVGSKPLSKSHRTFSADGKMMTIAGISIRPDGSQEPYEETYKRLSGTSGLPGKWLDVKVKPTANNSMVIALSGSGLHFEFPSFQESLDTKLDGSACPVTGPTIPAGAVSIYKTEGPRKLHYTDKYQDKVLNEGTFTLSADGKSIIEEEWEPGKFSEKATLVYDKQ